jgi:hypothetical protein
MPYSYVPELCFRFHRGGWKLVLNVYPIVSCNQITQFQPTFADAGQFEQLATVLKLQNYDAQFFDENIAVREEDGRHFFQIEVI